MPEGSNAEAEPLRRVWLRAALWLAFLGPFFFLSYGFANEMAARRAHVGSVVYDWERSIPFLAWTIVPYWSIDLLYGLSFFVWRRRSEVHRHAVRLLAVQLISVVCFLLFPLRFSFARPAAHGVFGAMFQALGAFDKPFNQAPSLHISLLVVIWNALAVRVTRLRWVLHAWMALIALSTLTTYQHHFIDLPTGLLVGCVVAWLVPIDSPSPIRRHDGHAALSLALCYAFGAGVLGVAASLGGAWLWLFWPAVSLFLVACNYAFLGPAGFQKRSDGRLSVAARMLYAPYLVATWINSRAWTFKTPAPSHITDGVFVGRIPTRREMEQFDAVVDLTAEFSCDVPSSVVYTCVPVLDLTVAAEDELLDAARAIEAARARGRVLVCCALGMSRSASAVVAWLLWTRRAASLHEALATVRAARPIVILRAEHAARLEALA